MEKGTRKTRSQINVLSERKMSPFSPDLKQSTHISQQEIDREGGRGRGEGGEGGEGKKEGRKKERGREDREKGGKRRTKEETVKNYLMIPFLDHYIVSTNTNRPVNKAIYPMLKNTFNFLLHFFLFCVFYFSNLCCRINSHPGTKYLKQREA